MDNLIIKYTKKDDYLKISKKDDTYHNIGAISPTDGQLSVKEELWEILSKHVTTNDIAWADGRGRHQGTGYVKHSTDNSFTNVFNTIQYLRIIFIANNIECVFIINELV